MSAKSRKRADGQKPKRNPLEYHSTPADARLALLPRVLFMLPVQPPGVRTIVLDAGCGKGEWGESILALRSNVTVLGVEKHLTRARQAGQRMALALRPWANQRAIVTHGDLLSMAHTRNGNTVIYDSDDDGDGGRDLAGLIVARPHLVISNPPFSKAEAFLDAAKAFLAPGGIIALYLRIDWMAGVGRFPRHMREHPDLHVLSRRPSHRPDGKTDAQSYGLFVYHQDAKGLWVPVLTPAKPKKPRAPRKARGRRGK